MKINKGCTNSASSRRILRNYFAVIATVILCSNSATAQTIDNLGNTQSIVLKADKQPQNWLSYGRTYSEQRYSPLNKINRKNVGGLKLDWYIDLDTNRGQEGTPLVVDGVMYVITAWSKVIALDAVSGKILWRYDPQVPGRIGVLGCCDTVNRGLAYDHGKIFVPAFDGRLIALDATSGKVLWSVDTIPQDAALGEQRAYTMTGAPRVVKGLVLIGNGGAEFGARGFVSAYHIDSGKLAWRFFTVPNAKNEPDHAPSDNVLMNKAYSTWSKTGAWIRQGGGGTVWDSIVYDPVTDLVYIGVGNGSPWNYALRSNNFGDNLFLGSIVAIRPETGEYVWHFQETPMDQWDYTSVQQIMTLDLMINGQKRHVIVHAPKNGFFYILDAKTGEFISGKNFVPVTWASGLDPITGRPNFNRDALYALSGKAEVVVPGPLGAHNWAPMAYSPQTNLVYIPAQQIPGYYDPAKTFTHNDKTMNMGLVKADPRNSPTSTDKPAAHDMPPTDGWIIAWDPIKQQEAFRVDHHGPWNGGLLATAGGLLFQGLANGGFHAYDVKDGKDLFEFNTQTGVIAPPMTYEVEGKQYVALMAGWGGAFPLGNGASFAGKSNNKPQVNRSRLLVFSLDGKASLPPVHGSGFEPVKPPVEYKKEAVTEGYVKYTTFCSSCHGGSVVSGGVLPDLRWSGAIRTEDGFYNVVGKGALRAYGMVDFGDDMTPDQIEAIRNYIIDEANHTYEKEVINRQPSPKQD
ncbi:PQQ-dependent dehydrogenase, methanol/ethanol family [Bartonella sp. LJL80]